MIVRVCEHNLWRDGQHPQVASSSSPSSLWRGGDTPKLATSGVMVNIRKSSHRHRHTCSRSDITRYPCYIIMLLVLFNKIRVHSYDIVFCSFLVSSLGTLISVINDHC